MIDPDNKPNPAFILVWSGQLVSLLGSSAATTVLSLAVFTHSGRVVDLATVIAVKFAVGVYTAPLVGRIIDHCSRRVALSWCDGALACSSVTLGLLLSTEGPSIGVVAALVAVSGVFDGAVSLLLVSSVRMLRREADLTRVNGLVTVIENGPLLLGPPLGAVLYTWVSPPAAFYCDAASFVFALVTVQLVRWPGQHHGDSGTGLFGDAAAGVMFILRHRHFRVLQLCNAGHNFLNGLGVATWTAYVIAAGSNGATSLSTVKTAAAAGSVLGGLAVGALATRVGRRRLLLWGYFAGALLGRVVPGLVAALPVWVVGSAARAGGAQLFNGPATAIWQEQVERDRQGSVFGARRLLGQGPYPLAVLLGGTLGDVFPNHLGLFLVTLGCAEVAVGGVLAASRAVRELAAAPMMQPHP